MELTLFPSVYRVAALVDLSPTGAALISGCSAMFPLCVSLHGIAAHFLGAINAQHAR